MLSKNLLAQTKQLCQKYGIKPVRSRGQNFLISESVYDKIIQTADLNKNDVVLEVGPGLGFLTQRIAGKVKKVIAVELDDKLAQVLKIRLKKQGIKNVEIINKNILDINFLDYYCHEYKIVANLPYNITSIFLRKFLSAKIKPSLVVLMLQKEVAQRIVASPPKMSLLSVSVQFFASPKIIDIVKADDFWPQPKVDSAIIKLSDINDQPNEKDFFRLVKIGFSARRKMLKNNFAAGLKISQTEAGEKLKALTRNNSHICITSSCHLYSKNPSKYLDTFQNFSKTRSPEKTEGESEINLCAKCKSYFVSEPKKAGFDDKIRAQELSVDDWIQLLFVFDMM